MLTRAGHGDVGTRAIGGDLKVIAKKGLMGGHGTVDVRGTNASKAEFRLRHGERTGDRDAFNIEGLVNGREI
jgi:hypothetical protein